jgi:signal transduction histidine kinase
MRLALPSLLLLFAPVTFALDTTRSTAQYGHTMWTLQDGASILEDSGGKLSVSALLVDHQNALWIGTAGEGLYRLHGGKVSHYRAADGRSNNTVQGLFEDRAGTLWVITAEGIATLDFSITPTFYQTPWFDALCIIAGAGILWLLYLARVRQIEIRIRMRLEERVIERERLARDLHDTLLQSMQGLILRFQAVLARIPEGGERPLQMMEQALERADQVLAEGRDHVYDLRRSTHASNDLPQALQALAQELAQTADNTRFRVTVEGAPQKLQPVVREETYRIGAEALTNAVRHAMATQVDIEIAYSRKSLTLRVIDNGRGFDGAALNEGTPRGHFGFAGMRERARRIRARIEVSTRAGSGSAVEVRVPASIAYRVERRVEAQAV